MKAIQLVKYGSAKTAFKTAKVPTPKLVNKEDILIKVQAFGLNFADVMARKGLYKAAPALPAILGYEIVGEVVKVNDDVNNNLIGKRVLSLTRFGGYAEFIQSTSSSISILSDFLSNGEALALATQYCTAFLAVETCSNLKESDAILVHSASGGVGTAITQLAKLKGCKVFGLTRSASKVDYLKSNGVDFPIVTSEIDYLKSIKVNPFFSKVQATFNSVGGETLKKDIQLLDKTGEMVFFGISDRTNQKKGLLFTIFQLLKIGKIHPAKLLLNSQSIHGLNLLTIGDKNPEQITNALEKLISLVEYKKITPNAKHGFDWDQIAFAHQGIENGDFTGKVYININN
jgi:NADPH2:quinone reductase